MSVRNIIYIGIFVILFAIRVLWQGSMPDDKEKVCSFSGKGYVISNGFTGVFIRRYEALDENCARRMK